MLRITLVTIPTWKMIYQDIKQEPLDYFNFPFGATGSHTVWQQRINMAILMENQDLQQSLMETNARTPNIIKIHHTKNRHMINRLVGTLKSTGNTRYQSKLLIKRLNYTQNFFFTLADIVCKLNQVCNRLNKLDSDISTIYNYINTLSIKIITILIDHIDPRAILINIKNVTPPYLSLPSNSHTNIWTFYEFLKIHPLVFSDTLIISLIVSLADNTFHIQIYAFTLCQQ